MENNKKANILIVGLVDDFICNLSSELAFSLDKYYLNIDNMISYAISERQKMLDLCGKKYLEEQENKVILSLKDFENTLMSTKFSTFVAYIDFLKNNCKIVYAQLDYKNIKCDQNILATENLNFLVFKERETFLKNNCDIAVKCDINSLEESIDAIKKHLT